MIWRYILAFTLSMAVIVLWPLIFPPQQAPLNPPGNLPAVGDVPAVEAPRAIGVGGAEITPLPAEPSTPAEESSPLAAAREVFPTRRARVEVPDRLVAEVTSTGGVIDTVILPAFTESVEDDNPYQLLSPMFEFAGAFEIELGDDFIPRGENWQLEEFVAPDGRSGIRLENRTPRGLLLTKTILPGTAPGGSEDRGEETEQPYHLEFQFQVRNETETPAEFRYFLYGPQGVDSEMEQAPGTDIALIFGAHSGSELEVTADDTNLTGDRWERGDIAWVGIANNYFASVLVPGLPGAGRVAFVDQAVAQAIPDARRVEELAREAGLDPEQLPPGRRQEFAEDAYNNLRVGFRSATQRLASGESFTHDYTFFAGPRQRHVLAEYESLQFPDVNRYGTFGVLVNLFIGLLGSLKSITFGSWGAAIVLLTILVKACLHPINKRSQRSLQRSQKKMQKVKPEMDALKERFKDNPMKRNQELQRLFKEHNINPAQQLGGCLVLFLQFPIWYALYNTLRYAFGLRQQDFLYITDLTRPDHLFDMGVSLPVVGNYFNLLPVIYVILTVVNQQLQPKPEDPQMRAQHRMMSFMLVFFGIIFYSFPAGFMLYLMTSNALGLIESKIIKAELKREDDTASVVTVVSGGAAYPARGGSGGASAAKSTPRAPKSRKKKR